MHRVYSHPDIGIVQLVKNELENRGIEAVVQGEHLAGAVGGISTVDAWVELWVVEDDRVQEAAKIIQSVIEQEDVETGDPWTCPECAETIDAQFAVCWNCGHEPSVARDAG